MKAATLASSLALSLVTGASYADNPWASERAARNQAIESYIRDNDEAYVWFADFPFSTSDGIPFLILQLLPRLAPALWGSPENFLDVVGLFRDERNPDYPIARGIGWTGLAADATAPVDMSSFTCGACHIGRVRLPDGSHRYLDGGINAEFNIVKYRVRAYQTVQAISGDSDDPAHRLQAATVAITKALDQAHSENPNFFYGNYRLGERRFDAEYEAAQVAAFKADATNLIDGFMQRTTLEYQAFDTLVKKNYTGFEGPMLEGFGGMADATGISTSFGYSVSKAQGHPVDLEKQLPPSAGITDFMAVWEQGKRRASWNADNSRLVGGAGQWNGNIAIPIYRNLAAELTMGLANTDLRIGVFGIELLDGIPAPPYPFPVDTGLAAKGKGLFERNCADCHRAHNGEVYDMGTDIGRALVVSETIADTARRGFTATCGPDTRVTMPSGETIRPCAEFDGVSLEGKSELAMLPPSEHRGYNALPLGGIWAQAPYLHNGSVPTLYHLLVPGERPDAFIKGNLNYDARRVGFDWSGASEMPQTAHSYYFDTRAFSAFSKRGHDTDITHETGSYKLDWSDDPAGAMAIIEYMKTF